MYFPRELLMCCFIDVDVVFEIDLDWKRRKKRTLQTGIHRYVSGNNLWCLFFNQKSSNYAFLQ